MGKSQEKNEKTNVLFFSLKVACGVFLLTKLNYVIRQF